MLASRIRRRERSYKVKKNFFTRKSNSNKYNYETVVYYVLNEMYVVKLHSNGKNSVDVCYLPRANQFTFIFACKIKTVCVLRITAYVCCVRKKIVLHQNVLRFSGFFQ